MMYVQNTQKKQRKNRGKTRITPIHSESECLRQAGSVGGGLVREALTDYPRQTTNLNQGHTNYHDSSFCAWPFTKKIGRGLFADTLEYTRRKNEGKEESHPFWPGNLLAGRLNKEENKEKKKKKKAGDHSLH